MIPPPTQSEPFSFDPALHICRDAKGQWVPSVTQILDAQGLSTDWDGVALRIGRGDMAAGWDHIDRKSKLGSEVHDLTDIYDEFGSMDPSWLNADNEGYLRSWVGFREVSGFIPVYISTRLVARVNGMRFTGEIDKFGLLQGKYPAIIDLKCSEMNPSCWGYQIAAYEQMWFASPRCGRVIRANVRLKKDGSPGQLIERRDHDNDASQFMAALVNATERIKHGLLKEPTQ